MRVLIVVLLCACGDDAATPGDSAPCIDLTHDEDGDAVGDTCDICPAAPDPRQLDSTERATMAFPDGVGDACDPRPSLSGDNLGAFHSFADPSTAAAWNGTGFTIANDRATATDAARWVHRTREQGDGLFVQVRISQLAWLLNGRFDVILDGDGVGSGMMCSIFRDRDADGFDELEAREIAGAATSKMTTMPITGAVTITAWRIIDVQRRGELRCRVKSEADDTELQIPTSDDLAIGLYGIGQQGSATNVESVIVYTSPMLPMQKL